MKIHWMKSSVTQQAKTQQLLLWKTELVNRESNSNSTTAFVNESHRVVSFDFAKGTTRQYALQKGSTIAVTGEDKLQFFGLLLLSGYHTNENLFWSSAEDTPLY
ncbi:hypothetical protein T10_3274 [Trichinella papuae]|uniref:PiggyBac transposable element-derived protein domain-containing protein n=1 Tax=Trichinella papuae TaxID=268474 RepID=A0A0V1MRJ8_9BILA|nr:hypothetical protein T10_3274 [Trichinella papuae]